MKRSLRYKIFTAFLLILLIFTSSNIWSIINFNRLSKSIDSIMESNYKSIEAAQYMIVAIERQDSAELEHMFSKSDETVAAFNKNGKVFLGWLSRAEDNITEEGEAEILQRINESYTKYITSFTQLIILDRNNNQSELNDYYYTVILPLFEETKSACRDLLALNQNSMVDRKDSSLNVARGATITTAVISVITILMGLYMVSFLARKIVRPLYDFIDRTKRISEGNYNQQLEISGDDEIAQLAYEFNMMAEKLVHYDQMNINKLLEEKNKSDAIVNSIGDGIIVTDIDYKIALLNRKAESIFNVREAESVGRHLLEIINNKELFGMFRSIREKSEGWANIKPGEIEIKVEEGTEYYTVNVRPIKMKGTEDIGAVALIQNVTELKEVDALKSDFISTVSHEFRTPLTSIAMGVGLLQEGIPGTLTDKQKELVSVIKEDSDRLNKLVEELLDLSKLESGKMQMDLQSHNINEIADYVLKTLKLQAEEINAKITKNIPKDISKARIDVNKITWVVTNLVGNALRYVPKDGTGKIDISAKEAYNKIIISVSDNGAGIKDSIKKKIFDKFVQGADGSGSAGLGLAICKEIVRAHGGDIWVESSPGNGSTFIFTVNTL
ncbi:MAG: HAMP domain-containing protein [Clostridia bacterium]|nr:HAMP domain-containing protein [Clostridia bacterium]